MYTIKTIPEAARTLLTALRTKGVAPLLLVSFLLAGGSLLSCGSSKKTACIDQAKINPGPCTREYRPVCGCDGKTYGNACEAERAGLTSWEEGACN